MNVQAKVAIRKEKHPEDYCPQKRCLWRTGGGYCPRHIKQEKTNDQTSTEACTQDVPQATSTVA